MIKDLEYTLKNIFFSEKFLLKKRLKRALKNNYEKELKLIESFGNKKKNAVDVGVYRGVYSYKLSKHFKKVYSYEPNPLLYPYLKKNLGQIIQNMTISNLALSDKTGNINLRIPKRSRSIFKKNIEELYQLGCATIHHQNQFIKYDSFTVKKEKLDNLLQDEQIGFIKIDVEGHESEVIKGSLELIKKQKPILLIEIEERHSKKPVFETIKFINSLGYKSYYLEKKKIISTNNLNDFKKNNNYLFKED